MNIFEICSNMQHVNGRVSDSGADKSLSAPENKNATSTLERKSPNWVTVVHNDPVNLMSYVQWILESYFNMDANVARIKMLQIHNDGRAIVARGGREKWNATHKQCILMVFGQQSNWRESRMIAFRIVRGGYRAMATPDECELLCSLARDVIYILGADIEEELERANERKEFLAQNGVFSSESEIHSNADRESLLLRAAAIEEDLFTQLEDEFAGIEERLEDEVHKHEFNSDQAPAQRDDALVRLLPDMSEDPGEATELRELTEESISLTKVENLTRIYQSLKKIVDGERKQSAGFRNSYPQDLREHGGNYSERETLDSGKELLNSHYDVFVPNEDAPFWLAAINDIRLVLATRLEIDDDAINESVYERSQLFTSHSMVHDENIPEIESPDDMMTVLYTMLSWWQESLVSAVRNKALRR
ncbi:ATP-dependent Clp protease adaptor ClpS [Arcanobacterium hippocoleae]